jgi:hypothetical protein
VQGFRTINFADQATGRIYLRIESGVPVSVDGVGFQAAICDPDTLSGVRAVAPGALRGEVADTGSPQYLPGEGMAGASPTLGQWGDAARDRT